MSNSNKDEKKKRERSNFVLQTSLKIRKVPNKTAFLLLLEETRY